MTPQVLIILANILITSVLGGAAFLFKTAMSDRDRRIEVLEKKMDKIDDIFDILSRLEQRE